MKIYNSSISLVGSLLGKENPLPFFRDKEHNRPILDGGLLPEEKEGFGYETSFRVLPYKMQDSYERANKTIDLKTIIMENDFLRVTFLPEYGGRLYSIFSKKLNRELMYKNPVFQPANLAIRNAWFSGGIEWNLGRFGHSFLSCSPVFFAICKDHDNNDFLRMYEYERCNGLFLQIDFHLPDDSDILFAHVSITNSHDAPVPIYWWTNIAVEENRNVRVFSATNQVIYIKPESLKGQNAAHSFSHGSIPFLETLDGLDATYPHNLPYSNEYFFQNPYDINYTWEAVAYDDGMAFWERSTPILRYRKMFCWGNQRGGRHWQEFLTKKGTVPYLEIQAGLSPTQVHGEDIGPKECIRFTQAFGGSLVDTDRVYDHWNDSMEYIHSIIDDILDATKLVELDKTFENLTNQKPYEILHQGSGWGALEKIRDKSIIPEGMVFDESTLTAEQKPWLALLEDGSIPQSPRDELPLSYMTDQRWLKIMEESVGHRDDINADTLLHYAIMLYENERFDEGINALKRSLSLSPSALNAAVLAMATAKEKNYSDACRYMDLAIDLGAVSLSKSFSVEAIKIYDSAGEYKKAWDFYNSLPEAQKNDDRIILEISNSAFQLGQWSFLDFVFSMEFTTIREGESRLIDLWYRKKAFEKANEEGLINYESILDQVMRECIPPYNIDFRMGKPRE